MLSISLDEFLVNTLLNIGNKTLVSGSVPKLPSAEASRSRQQESESIGRGGPIIQNGA